MLKMSSRQMKKKFSNPKREGCHAKGTMMRIACES